MKSMKQEKQQEIALMRYGAIAPIIAGLDERYPIFDDTDTLF